MVLSSGFIMSLCVSGISSQYIPRGAYKTSQNYCSTPEVGQTGHLHVMVFTCRVFMREVQGASEYIGLRVGREC
jgi:hypothetical protein